MTKIQQQVQEQKDMHRYGKVRGLMFAYCKQEWFDEALALAKETGCAEVMCLYLTGA